MALALFQSHGDVEKVGVKLHVFSLCSHSFYFKICIIVLRMDKIICMLFVIFFYWFWGEIVSGVKVANEKKKKKKKNS